MEDKDQFDLEIQGLRIGVANPMVLKASGVQRAPCLRFSVIFLVDDLIIAEIPGFRLSLGQITPPQSRGAKGGFFSLIVTKHSKWEKLMRLLTATWRLDSRFANIEFPEILETNGSSAPSA